MATITANEQSTSHEDATPEKKLANFTLAVSVLLYSWPALSVAVQESWGSISEAEALDKRDWFCGAVVDLFTEQPGTDQEDVEDMLLQVMGDEYEVGIEDGSEIDIAEKIMRAREECERGEFERVRALFAAWEKRKGKSVALPKGMQVVQHGADDEDEDDGDDSEEDDEDDVVMGNTDVPAVKEVKAKLEPEVDEDGFTKVVGKKRAR